LEAATREIAVLGFYLYPIPEGTAYTADDLENPDKVIELFGYCGIGEGIVTMEGWDFLIRLYGYERLFQLDKEAMWLDSDSIEEYIEEVQYERDIASQCR